MDKIELKKEVIKRLQTLSVCIPNSQKTQWVVRCPYCGDSNDPTHGHFSIKIDLNSDDPMFYRCFKCPESGILSAQVLEDIGCGYDSELGKELTSYNKTVITKNPFLSMNNKDYVVPLCIDNKYNIKKYYINERLGLDLSYDDYRKCKVIFNTYQFLEVNHIKSIPGVSWKYLKFIDSNYVGFLSNNNNRITFRCIHNRDDMLRYIKVKLDNDNISPNNFYMIPNSINLLYTNEMNIHLAEGTFDILSIFYNVMNQDSDNNLYYASCGFNINTIIRYILNKGINTDLNIHIYSDNDKTDKDHMKYLLTPQNKIWLDKIYIHRNIYPGEKDYGVPKNKIVSSMIQLK